MRTSEKTMTSTIHITGINAINLRMMKLAIFSLHSILEDVIPDARRHLGVIRRRTPKAPALREVYYFL
jgi:hypothetical protein